MKRTAIRTIISGICILTVWCLALEQKTFAAAAEAKSATSKGESVKIAAAKKKNNDPKVASATPSTVSPVTDRTGKGRDMVGIGVHVNALNVSAGPALMLWPLENVGFEITYGLGLATTYEVRGMYKFRPMMTVNPYVGAGYLHAEKTETVVQVDITKRADSVEVFGGIERALYKKLHGYVEVAATPLRLGTVNVTSGTNSGSQEAVYFPVTIGVGLIWYVF